MAQKAKAYGDVYLAIGGSHLGDKTAREVETVIAELKRLGVRQVAPSHCAGERAIEQFKAAFRRGFHPGGRGFANRHSSEELSRNTRRQAMTPHLSPA